MNFYKATFFTSIATGTKILVGLVLVKLIAIAIGPEGFGKIGQFMSVSTILSVLSGGGIFTGMTKYVSEYGNNDSEVKKLIKAGSTIVCFFSIMILLLALLFSVDISIFLFDTGKYSHVIVAVGFVQLLIGWSNFLHSIIKGRLWVVESSIALTLGSLSGLLVAISLIYLFDFEGSLLGLLAVPAMVFFPCLLILIRKKIISLNYFLPGVDRVKICNLLKYTMMLMVTVVSVPGLQIVIRNFIAQKDGWEMVGYWQGVLKISDAYLSFILAALSAYFLPTLSSLRNFYEFDKEVKKTFTSVFLLVCLSSVLIYFSRDLAISLLYTKDFYLMRDFFNAQLVGDIFRISSYVLGYVAVAKSLTRIYMLAEIFQFLLISFFSFIFISKFGAIGATYGYACSYIIYFSISITVYFKFRRNLFEG